MPLPIKVVGATLLQQRHITPELMIKLLEATDTVCRSSSSSLSLSLYLSISLSLSVCVRVCPSLCYVVVCLSVSSCVFRTLAQLLSECGHIFSLCVHTIIVVFASLSNGPKLFDLLKILNSRDLFHSSACNWSRISWRHSGDCIVIQFGWIQWRFHVFQAISLRLPPQLSIAW
jgi:hypothetical protein